MQTLLNSLTAYNARYRQPNERWKIRDEYASVKNADGTPIVTKERVAYVAGLMRQQYELLVRGRGMHQQPIDETALGKVVNFLTNTATRTSMLLIGTPGTGKTTLMRSAYMVIGFLYRDEISSHKISSKWAKASDLGALLKQDKEGYKEHKNATCLFIDDMGFNGESEVVNDYGVKARPIEDIIEHRYDRQLLTMCTSNLTEGEIRKKYGERIYSRICEAFGIVAMAGTDYRQMARY